MNFNDNLTRHQNNLDNALDALLDAGDREALEREEFEELMLSDLETFRKYATMLMEDGSKTGTELLQGLLDWAWQQYQKENSPAHTKAWEEE